MAKAVGYAWSGDLFEVVEENGKDVLYVTGSKSKKKFRVVRLDEAFSQKD